MFFSESRVHAAFSQLSIYANIQTIGLVISGISLPTEATLEYRQAGDEGAWKTGHPLTLIDDGRLVGTIFDLHPATIYDVKISYGTDIITGITTTQVDKLLFIPSNTVHVAATAPSGGDGTAIAPFQTIQEGVDAATNGTRILIQDGLYSEGVVISSSGTLRQWIQVIAAGADVIMDGAVHLSGNIWTPHATETNVWYTDFGEISHSLYVARDSGERSYRYSSLDNLLNDLGKSNIPIGDGWFIEEGTSTMYVRCSDSPTNHIWHVSNENYGFYAQAQDWIWIEGIKMRYFGESSGTAIRLDNCSHIVIRKNILRNNSQGIYIQWDGTDSQGNDTRIEYNDVSDPNVDVWPWEAVKGTTMEGSAVILSGHKQAIVRNNTIHHEFNGVYVGRWGDLENKDLCFDVDVYSNTFHHIGDDGMEPEGACINNRFHHNVFNNGLVAISLAPITFGPVWVLRNQFSNYNSTGLKFGIDGYGPDGRVYIYHNTIWTDKARIGDIVERMPAIVYGNRADNWVMRNNIFRGTWYAFRKKYAGGLVDHDWDYNNWFTTQGYAFFYMYDKIYETVEDFYNEFGLEQHGHGNMPGLVNPFGGVFSLQPSSPNIDRGERIPGINDNYIGNAPDIGAYEYIPCKGMRMIIR